MNNGLNMNIYVVDQNVFGSGDALTANITASSKSQQAKVSYSQPNYSGNGAGRSISANISRLSRDGEDTTNYSFDEYGLSSSWSMPISKTISTGIQASYSRMNFFNVDKASSLVQQYFENRSHELDIASVGTTLSYSDLDNAYEPTKGKSLRGSVKTTLPVSDAAKFYNFETEGRYYYPLTEMFDQTIVFRTRLLYSHAIPYDGDDLPFFARKYAGGMGTVRGYENGMLGQKYQDDVFNEIDGNRVLIASKVKAKGGGILAVGNAEVQLPSPMPDFVTPCLFVDIGNVFENYDSIDLSMLRGSAGITFSAKLPVMQAKVSLSFGVPFNQGDEEYDMMSFGFGTMF